MESHSDTRADASQQHGYTWRELLPVLRGLPQCIPSRHPSQAGAARSSSLYRFSMLSESPEPAFADKDTCFYHIFHVCMHCMNYTITWAFVTKI